MSEPDSTPDSSPPPEQTSGPVADGRESAREALAHLQIVNVVPVSLSANLVEDADGSAQGARYEVELQYRSEPGFFDNRFRYRIEIVDADDAPIAQIDFALRVDFDVAGEYEVPAEAAEFLTQTTSYFGAYPYARELAQMLTTRLQLNPVVLGLLHHGSFEPSAVSTVSP